MERSYSMFKTVQYLRSYLPYTGETYEDILNRIRKVFAAFVQL